MLEDLKTTRYNDGTAIPNVTDYTAWGNLTTGAWVYPSFNNPNYNSVYGKLYNWYAVGTGKLAPIGWHVPTDAELTILTTYLGGNNVAGGAMKATILWNSPNTGATNSSGFTALPAGMAYSSDMGIYGYISSSTEYNISNSLGIVLSSSHMKASRSYGVKTQGKSVRCIKD